VTPASCSRPDGLATLGKQKGRAEALPWVLPEFALSGSRTTRGYGAESCCRHR
jgi:hypothetical protein